MSSEQIKYLISISSGFGALVAVIDLHHLYGHFGLHITEYVQFSELVILIATKLLGVTVAMICAFVAYIFLKPIFGLKPEHFLLLNRPNRIWSMRYFYCYGIFSAFAIALYFNLFKSPKFNESLWFAIFTPAIVVLYNEAHILYNKHFKKIWSSWYLLAVMGCYFFFAYNIWFTNIDIKEIEKGRFAGTVIQTQDSTYRTDTVHLYIGKTQNFLFVCNRDSGTTTAIAASTLKQLTIKYHHVNPY